MKKQKLKVILRNYIEIEYNQDIRKLFQRIILDEKNHIKIFKKIIEMQKNV